MPQNWFLHKRGFFSERTLNGKTSDCGVRLPGSKKFFPRKLVNRSGLDLHPSRRKIHKKVNFGCTEWSLCKQRFPVEEAHTAEVKVNQRHKLSDLGGGQYFTYTLKHSLVFSTPSERDRGKQVSYLWGGTFQSFASKICHSSGCTTSERVTGLTSVQFQRNFMSSNKEGFHVT